MERAGETGEGLSAVFYGSVPGAYGAQPGPYLPGAMLATFDIPAPKFIIGNLEISKEGLTVDGKTVTDAGEIYAALMRALNRGIPAELDLSGAAVRGEPVAMTERVKAMEEFYQASVGWEGVCGHPEATLDDERRAEERFIAAGKAVRELPASARAADARSEPTDLSHRLRETADKQPGWKPLLTAAADEIERYYGGMLAWKKTAEKKDRDWQAERMGRVDDRIKARAADARESQPTVLAYVATDLDGRADVGMTRQKAMERAGHGCDTIIPVYDLGSNQPTDPNFNSGLTPEEIRARMRHHTRAEKVAERCRRAEASSQPTDGEVRIGCGLKAVHDFLMGESALEGVQFGEKHPTKAGAHWWRLNLRAALAKG